MLRLALDPVPVNQCEAYSGIIGSDPRAAFGLARKNSATIRKIDNRRRQRSGTRKFFVAIHCEIKPTQFGTKEIVHINWRRDMIPQRQSIVATPAKVSVAKKPHDPAEHRCTPKPASPRPATSTVE